MGALRRWLVVAVLVVAVGMAVAFLSKRPKTVEVVYPQETTLAEAIALSGRVHGVEESRLAPEVAGTIRKLLVAEGALVKKGQKLALLDTAQLLAQLGQARERVRVAEAQLAVARRGPLPSELEQVRAEVEAQRLAAQASLSTAEQRLLQAQRGPRAEQVAQAQAALREAGAEQEQRAREAERQARLLAAGAVSSQSAEQAATGAKRAAESRRSAAARLQELQNGTRPEELEQARQAVRSAESEVLSAQQAGQARIEQLRALPRPEDVQLAQAQVGEARAALRTAQEQLAKAELLAPYDGLVGRRLLRVGDQTGPNLPVFTFSSSPALEIRVDIDESDRGRLSPGLKADARAQGFPEVLSAQLRELAPEVDSVRGTLEARLTPKNPPSWLVPGQTVDVNLILEEQRPHLVLPLTCIILKGDTAEVVVVEGEVCRPRAVTISSPTLDGYIIREGVTKDDKVALYPQGLVDGQVVRAKPAAAPR